MIKFSIFNLIFCTLLSYGISFNTALSLGINSSTTTNSQNINTTTHIPDLQTNIVDPNTSSISETTLNRTATSINTSELFAKVIDLEEQLHELNGRLQNSERLNLNLTRKLNNLYSKVESIAMKNYKSHSNSDQRQKDKSGSITEISHPISLIKQGKNVQAIKLLNAYLQKAKTQKKQLENEGEIYYWLAKAYMNQKAHNKATYNFTRSYKYYSNIKLNNILVELIEALEQEKKYKQICALVNKLNIKSLNALSEVKQNKIKTLKTTHCRS